MQLDHGSVSTFSTTAKVKVPANRKQQKACGKVSSKRVMQKSVRAKGLQINRNVLFLQAPHMVRLSGAQTGCLMETEKHQMWLLVEGLSKLCNVFVVAVLLSCGSLLKSQDRSFKIAIRTLLPVVLYLQTGPGKSFQHQRSSPRNIFLLGLLCLNHLLES